MFQASQGKNFHQKLTISDDSKMIPKYVPADLGLPSSACQSRMVKNNKLDHVFDTIFGISGHNSYIVDWTEN